MQIEDLSRVAWQRLAAPQPDQYDALVALAFARQRGYVRQGVGSDPTFFDGRVAIRSDSVSLEPHSVPASADHPNIRKGCDLIRLWPNAFAQFQLLIESVGIFTSNRHHSCSGGRGFGTIAATITDYLWFAEALLHEMAHHKLSVLGVGFDSAELIIKNPVEQKFRSPVRHDCLRPMAAVLQDQYALTYRAALDIEIIKAAREPERDYRIAKCSLADKLPKLEFGLRVIRDNVEVDSAGAQFLAGLFLWSDSLLEEGRRILDGFRIPLTTFTHPLDTIRPLRLKTVSEHDLWDEALLYSSDGKMAVSLNSSAKAIWKLCDGRYTAIEISQELGRLFGCPGDGLLQHTIEAIIQLGKYGLVHLRDGSGITDPLA